MNEFFDWIIDFLASGYALFESFVRNAIMFINMIPKSIKVLTHAVAFVPPLIAGFAAATIIASVFLVMYGRHGGGQNK